MVKYNSDRQLTIEEFKTPFQASLPADQYITYPTDNGILNQSRKQCEKFIDKLYDLSGKEGEKPRTYRRKIDKALEYSNTSCGSPIC